MSFMLHPNFSNKNHIIDLPLCSVFLEDVSHYPWLLLIPRRNKTRKMIDLSFEDQAVLFQEMTLAQTLVWDLFSPAQINVAALGNKTPQLHIHVIARYENDPAWPDTVWDHPDKKPYSNEELHKISAQLKEAFQSALASEKSFVTK